MKRATIAILMCAALLPASCKKKQADSKAPSTASADMKAMTADPARPAMEAARKAEPRRAATRPAAAPPAKIVIKLVDAGKGKKQKLRYQFVAGTSHVMVMDMLMKNHFKFQGREMPVNMPKMRYRLNVKVDKAAEAGWSHFVLGGISIGFPDPPQGARGKAIVAAMEKAKSVMAKMTFSYDIDSRGFFKHVHIALPPTAPAPMRAMMKQIGGSMKQSLMFSTVPLPEQAVGQGAKWTAVVPMNLPMMKFTAHMEYVVKKLKGDTVTLAMKMKGVAPKQQMKLPGGQGSMDLDKLDTSASGTLTLSLVHPVPTGELVTETAMVGKAAGSAMEMKMHMNLSLKKGK